MVACHICGAELIKFLSLGQQPIANRFLRKEQLGEDEYMFELATGFCDSCKMVQLVETVPKEQLFNENYAYYSSVSKTMEKHFESYASSLAEEFMEEGDLIIEIGCNDGIMLKHFDKTQFRVLGVEPSANVAKAALERGLNVDVSFFDSSYAQQTIADKGKAKVIYAANVICHIEAIHEVARGVKRLLQDRGVFVFEDPYLLDILEKKSYDQIYDEHVWFFSVTSLKNLLKEHGLMIFDARKQTTHGGSMRYYICHKGAYPIHDRVHHAEHEETAAGVSSLATYQAFAQEVAESKAELFRMLKELKAKGMRIAGYAASSKGTVVLNYCNIGRETLDYITDNTPTKQGLYSPGKHIPIVSPDEFQKDPPDYALLLAWNYAKEIQENEKETRTKFIVHYPKARIL